MRLPQPLRSARTLTVTALAAAALAACGGGDGPIDVELEKIGGFGTGQFAVSAAEIPAFDPMTQRVFVVNALSGRVDVLDLSDPANPVKIDEIAPASGTVNSVAVKDGLVALAIEASPKTNPGRVALYKAGDLSFVADVEVGALPDMLTFTPDGKTILVANEGEPSDDYQVDPEGSISVIDIGKNNRLKVRTADFSQFNKDAAKLREQGVRIYGPRATVAQDLEPEYIAVSADGKTAWVVLQENNALAKINIASAKVTDILPLGYKDHGQEGNELDVSDDDGQTINIRNWAGVHGMYLPDAMVSYEVKGKTYLVTANEGDARAWGEDTQAYFGIENADGTVTPGDPDLGFVEEFRVRNLVNPSGWGGRVADDLPPQLNALAAGGLLNPETFGYCGAIAGNPGNCRDVDVLGRLNITWTMGYRMNPDGSPVRFNASGAQDPAGNRLMYDKLFSYGARSFSIWNDKGELVWDSGADIEKFLASDACMLGTQRNIPCADFFNSGHDEGDAKDSRSDAKGPEPEGVAVGEVSGRTLAFIGLERMGGVLVYDITDPRAPERLDYLNTREDWTTDIEGLSDDGLLTPARLAEFGDLGPEGLVFIPAQDSPNRKPLLVVGNEVSGTTAVFQLNVKPRSGTGGMAR